MARWFNTHFDLAKEEQSSWVIQAKSCQGCLVLLVVVLPIVLISLGYTIFLIFKVYPIVFTTLITRLGIASELSLPLLITAFLGCFINLPLFVLTAHQPSGQREIELLPVWLLKCGCFRSYNTQWQPCGQIKLNVSGELIPIVLALYQFYRVQPIAILGVTAIVGVISYFWVTVIPGRAIVTRRLRFWLITIVAALSAMMFVLGGVNRPDVSIAFAGGVLGTTIGADLLHLKDVCPKDAEAPLSIGGAGLDDGIAQCGLFALIIAEWLPTVMSWLSSHQNASLQLAAHSPIHCWSAAKC